jgi:hypothetical protein
MHGYLLGANGKQTVGPDRHVVPVFTYGAIVHHSRISQQILTLVLPFIPIRSQTVLVLFASVGCHYGDNRGSAHNFFVGKRERI